MFRIYASTPVRGDETCGYSITLDKEYTVREFIETVLTELSGEWGYFGINADGSIFGNPCCEYKWGKLLSSLPEEYLDKKITKVTGDGGWSRMDYQFWVN